MAKTSFKKNKEEAAVPAASPVKPIKKKTVGVPVKTAVPQAAAQVVPPPQRPVQAVPVEVVPPIPAAPVKPVVTAAPVQQAVQPPPQQSKAIVTQQHYSPQALGTVQGHIDQSDMQFARIYFCQATSDAVQLGFAPGDVVMDNMYGLFRAGMDPVKFIVLMAKKQFEQDIPFGQGMPEVVDTPQEVRERGGTYGHRGATWNSILRCQVLIEMPEPVFDGNSEAVDCPAFNYEFNGKRYAQASIILRSTGYKAARTILTTNSQLSAANRLLHHTSFELTVKQEKGNSGMYYVPLVRRAEMNSPEFIQWVENIHAGADLSGMEE